MPDKIMPANRDAQYKMGDTVIVVDDYTQSKHPMVGHFARVIAITDWINCNHGQEYCIEYLTEPGYRQLIYANMIRLVKPRGK